MSLLERDALARSFGYTGDMKNSIELSLSIAALLSIGVLSLAVGCSGSDGGECSGVILDETRADSPVVVNEVKIKSDDDVQDWIELFNTSSSSVDLSCWSIVDKSDKHTPYYVADGTSIAPGGFVVLNRDKTGQVGYAWGFGDSDTAVLRDSDGRIADETTWNKGDAPAGTSWGRSPDGTGALQKLTPPTMGAPNSSP